jgi:hypothetical protein
MLHWHVALACAAHAVATFGNAIVAVSAPSLVAQVAMRPPEFALFLALYSAPNAILPPLWAICMAPLGPAPLAAAASFLAAVGAAIQYTAIHHRLASFTLLCVGRVLFGVGAEMLMAATDAWATSHAESAAERQRVAELLGAATQVGRALAFAGTPHLLVAHRAAPFLLASMLCTCVMIALLGSAVADVMAAHGSSARDTTGALSVADKRRVLNANQRVWSSAAFVCGCGSGDAGCLLLSLFCINALAAAAFHPFEVHFRYFCRQVSCSGAHSHVFSTLSLFPPCDQFIALEYLHSRTGSSLASGAHWLLGASLASLLFIPLARRLLHVTGNLPLLCACASLLLAGGTMLFCFDDLFAIKPMARPNSWLMLLAFCAQQLAACLLFAAAPPALMYAAPERHSATARAMAKAVFHLVTTIVLLCWGQFLMPAALVDLPGGNDTGQTIRPPDGYASVFVSLLLIDSAIFVASITVLARDCALPRPQLATPGITMSLSLYGMSIANFECCLTVPENSRFACASMSCFASSRVLRSSRCWRRAARRAHAPESRRA